MNHLQIVTVTATICVSFLAVLIGVLLNNARLTDLRAYTDGRFNSVDQSLSEMRDALRSEIRSEIRASLAETRLAIGELKALIEKNHSETLMRFADVDRRLSTLEAERKVPQ